MEDILAKAGEKTNLWELVITRPRLSARGESFATQVRKKQTTSQK